MNKKIFVIYGVVVLLVSPLLVFAVPGVMGGSIMTVINTVGDVAERAAWSIAVTVVIIMFVIAGFKFLTAQGDPGKVGEARNAVIWGLAGAAVIVLAWSIVSFARSQFGV